MLRPLRGARPTACFEASRLHCCRPAGRHGADPRRAHSVLGRAYFPRTDPGQFIINVKMPSGTRIEVSDAYIARVEDEIRKVVSPHDLGMIVSNIGITPDLSAIYTPNSSMDTAFVQVSLNEDHSIGSYQYIDRVRRRLASDMPEIQTYFQAGGLVDSVINQGLPAPFDIQISSNDQDARLRQGAADRAAIARPVERRRCLHPAGPEVSRPPAQHRSRARLAHRPLAERCGRQRHHRAHLQRRDRAQLLDRPQHRQQLHAHGAVLHAPDRAHEHGGV